MKIFLMILSLSFLLFGCSTADERVKENKPLETLLAEKCDAGLAKGYYVGVVIHKNGDLVDVLLPEITEGIISMDMTIDCVTEADGSKKSSENTVYFSCNIEFEIEGDKAILKKSTLSAVLNNQQRAVCSLVGLKLQKGITDLGGHTQLSGDENKSVVFRFFAFDNS